MLISFPVGGFPGVRLLVHLRFEWGFRLQVMQNGILGRNRVCACVPACACTLDSVADWCWKEGFCGMIWWLGSLEILVQPSLWNSRNSNMRTTWRVSYLFHFFWIHIKERERCNNFSSLRCSSVNFDSWVKGRVVKWQRHSVGSRERPRCRSGLWEAPFCCPSWGCRAGQRGSSVKRESRDSGFLRFWFCSSGGLGI